MFPTESNNISHFIDSEGIENLEIVLKVTERCNIACTYCYYFFGGDESYSEREPIIPRYKILELISFIERGIPHGLKRVRIIFHGGEPLLMNKNRFSEMLNDFQLKLKDQIFIEYAIQTNAILIDDDWIKIFSDFKVFVGVSIDGPQEYNDLYRIDKGGRGTYQRTIAGIKKVFSAYSNGNIKKPGVICVINPNFDAKLIYSHLTRDLGFDNLHFLYQDLTHSETSTDYIEKINIFTSDLITSWLSDVENKVNIRFLNNYIKEIYKTPFQRDVISKYNRMRRLIVTVDSSGDIGPEDTLRSLIPNAFGHGINIKDSNLIDIFNNNDFMHIYQSENTIPNDCYGCDWKSVCRGGQLKNRYKDDDSSFNNKSIYCDVIINTLDTLAASLHRNGMSLDELSKRLNNFM